MEPAHAAAWHNLALVLTAQGAVLEALAAATRAAGAARDVPAYSGHKAQLERTLGNHQAALATLDAALARNPANASLRFELADGARTARRPRRGGECLRAGPARRTGQRRGAVAGAVPRMRLADWRALPALRERVRKGVPPGSPPVSPFVLLSQPATRAEQRRAAEAWTAAFTRPPPPASPRLLSGARLKLAYLSADFHTHATAYLATGLFEQHDRRRFEVVAYSTGPDDGSPLRTRVVGAFDRFVDAAGWPPHKVAAAIRADGIDILVDLKGHTERAPLGVLALRPAPIQVHYLGYPGTLGGTLADYLIADDVVAPPEDAADYAEALVQLPNSYQINDRQRPVAVRRAARGAAACRRGALVLCCFNNDVQGRPGSVRRVGADPGAVPDAVLWLLARSDEDPAMANLRREAAARGVDPARLIFARPRPESRVPRPVSPRRPLPRHLALQRAHDRQRRAVVRLPGGDVARRDVRGTGRGEPARRRRAAGADRARRRRLRGAGDRAGGRTRERRKRLRDHLLAAGRASPLFDTAATTRALEAAYLGMAEQYRQRKRRPFSVAPNSRRCAVRSPGRSTPSARTVLASRAGTPAPRRSGRP